MGPFRGECRLQSGGGSTAACNTSKSAEALNHHGSAQSCCRPWWLGDPLSRSRRSVPAANEAGLRCGHGTAGSVARIMGESREPLLVLHLQLIPLV